MREPTVPAEELPNYERNREIFHGNYGIAMLETDRTTGESVAVKYLERNRMQPHVLERELVIHRGIQHPHVIAFKEAVLTDTHVAIVLEYAAGGELYEQVDTVGPIDEGTARIIFQQIVSAMAFLHTRGVAHRDLKLENILLKSASGPPNVKICDFGFSRLIDQSGEKARDTRNMNTLLGTQKYMAPELLVQTAAGAQRRSYDGKKVDVWAVGVLLYAMLGKSFPFAIGPDTKKTVPEVLARFATYARLTTITPGCQDLFDKIFVEDPDLRISMEEILAHPWMQPLPDALRLGVVSEMQAPESLQTEEELRQIARDAAQGVVSSSGTDMAPADVQVVAQAEAPAGARDVSSNRTVDSGSSGRQFDMSMEEAVGELLL